MTTITHFIYDNEDILLELDGSNNITARYTHGPGIDEPLVMEKGGASFFYHADGLGSITEITDATGALKQQYTYSSFGKIESQLDPSFIQPYTFTAREFDPETGLHYYRARYYDPSNGRFLQEDPILAPFVAIRSGGQIDQLVWQLPSLINNPRLLHPFSYVRNNPTTLADPSGLFPKCPCGSHLRFSPDVFLSCIARNSAALGFFSVGCLGAAVFGLNPAIPLPVTVIALTATCGQASFIVGQCVGESLSCWRTL